MDKKTHNANRRQTLHGLAAAMASFTAPALISANALAQDKFPNKPITLIVPWTPAGPSDAVLRAFAESAKVRAAFWACRWCVRTSLARVAFWVRRP